MYKITNIKTNSMIAILSIITIFISFLPLVLFILNKTIGFYLKDPKIPLYLFIFIFIIGILIFLINNSDKKSYERNSILIQGKSLGFTNFRVGFRKIPILNFEYEIDNKKYIGKNLLVPYDFLNDGELLQILVKKNNLRRALVYNGYAPR